MTAKWSGFGTCWVDSSRGTLKTVYMSFRTGAKSGRRLRIQVPSLRLDVLVLLFCAICFSSQSAFSQQNSTSATSSSTREFIVSCTYGVAAGALVGAATLAFTQQPGENLRNIARGASIGLYAGILMGLYVVYILPNQSQDEDLPPGISSPEEGARWTPPAVFPLVSERGQVEGAAVMLPGLRF